MRALNGSNNPEHAMASTHAPDAMPFFVQRAAPAGPLQVNGSDRGSEARFCHRVLFIIASVLLEIELQPELQHSRGSRAVRAGKVPILRIPRQGGGVRVVEEVKPLEAELDPIVFLDLSGQ